MYKKGAVALILGQLILIIGFSLNHFSSTEAFLLSQEGYADERKTDIYLETMARGNSSQRVLTINEIQKQEIILNEEDYRNLLRIVEAEAGGEDETGKLLVANVVLNRVEDPAFPDTVTDVIFQKENGVCQFSPISDGRFYKVTVSEGTVKAVERALAGEDVSQGALYFVARKKANSEYLNWFDTKLTKLFSYGGHEFFL